MSFLEDLFISQPEKVFFAEFESKNNNVSIISITLSPLWAQLARIIPGTVAPSIITVAGLVSAIQAWYVVYAYLESLPLLATILAIVFLGLYLTLDALDGHHARNARQESPLGELFARMCNQIANIFTTLVFCEVLGIRDYQSQWALVSTAQLLSLNSRIRSLVAKGVSYFTSPTAFVGHLALTHRRLRLFTGSGEGVVILQGLLVYRYVYGLKIFSEYLDLALKLALSSGVQVNVTAIKPYLTAQYAYLAVLALIILQAIISLSSRHNATRNALIIALLYRSTPILLLLNGLLDSKFESITQVIADGLFLALLNSDLVLTRMAKGRSLNSWVVVLAMISVVNSTLTAALSLSYFAAVIYDLSRYLQISIFAPVVNVYVDGVYDLFHVGHVNAFKNALAFGTRLFVGVMSDEAVMSYKRAPVMTMAERVEAVKTCKFVHKVFPNAPFPGIPEEFIKKNNIHIVCLSAEYEKPDDIYYAVPRKMGITRLTPRTDGISTSELIKRIVTNAEALKTNKQTQSQGNSNQEDATKEVSANPVSTSSKTPVKTPKSKEKAQTPLKTTPGDEEKEKEQPKTRRARLTRK